MLTTIRDRIAPAIVGVDALNLNLLIERLDALSPGQPGAAAGVEMACVDLTARSLGVPIYTYLGGAVKDRLEFNASGQEAFVQTPDTNFIMIGERVVASMQRQAAEGEFRSNWHRGGTARLGRARWTRWVVCAGAGSRVTRPRDRLATAGWDSCCVSE